ncbi:hypothetical protein [Methanogenium organophilum]|uniref:Uncharacterized protein n=1 Tax=Methanogenium organophilum TaxID=2199 RepID=A0A9X9S6E8_METOG|nr:hypothetical protein [Methanogenium organophilum]WAI02278.1 hypothetical protein OU421_05240 [Methanogenium organophilum]
MVGPRSDEKETRQQTAGRWGVVELAGIRMIITIRHKERIITYGDGRDA